MERGFYSHGKLLLSGEYAILDGALGLAVPTKYGQSLKVHPTETQILVWTSLDHTNNVWFNATFNLHNLSPISSSNNYVSDTLQQLLIEAKKQNPIFLSDSKGVHVETKLDFPREWGLGSSSTLINNMAQWAEVDAYHLLRNAFGGSGYDIACAKSGNPIIYQLKNDVPIVEKISFSPPFKESLYFVYLNQKQSSKDAIANYRKKQFDTTKLVDEISSITKKMVAAETLQDFENLMVAHENLISEAIGLPRVRSQLFPDFPGAIKSLGAWGGDFVMVTSKEDPSRYFDSNGYRTLIPFLDMVGNVS